MRLFDLLVFYSALEIVQLSGIVVAEGLGTRDLYGARMARNGYCSVATGSTMLSMRRSSLLTGSCSYPNLLRRKTRGRWYRLYDFTVFRSDILCCIILRDLLSCLHIFSGGGGGGRMM